MSVNSESASGIVDNKRRWCFCKKTKEESLENIISFDLKLLLEATEMLEIRKFKTWAYNDIELSISVKDEKKRYHSDCRRKLHAVGKKN